jgi:hypothetical protein
MGSDTARPVSAERRATARHVRAAFGGAHHVSEYLDESEEIAVDLLRCDDRPSRGVTSYSTVGLSDFRIPWGEGEFPVRLEIAGACATQVRHFPNILASAAFRMVRTSGIYHPGAVIENYVRQYYPESPLPHLYFTEPFLWDQLTTFYNGSKKVTWLQAMPISESEHAYLKCHGDTAMGHLFSEHRINVVDLYRRPVVRGFG